MSEPLPQHLSRFTPDRGGLDRDALLFAVGHASARSSAIWLVLTVVLGISQVATLVLLWPRPPQSTVAPAVPPVSAPGHESIVPAESEPGAMQLGELRRGLLRGSEDLPLTQDVGSLTQPTMPLRAFGAPAGDITY